MDLLSDRIKHLLSETGESASSLAKKIGCSAAAVQQWLSGDTKNIKNDLLFAIADVTKFEARWIGTGKGPERKQEDERTKKLVEIYTQLDVRGRDSVFRIAEVEYNYTTMKDDKDQNAA